MLLLLGGALRLWDTTTLPVGFSQMEIDDIRIAETVRQGRIEVFYNVNGQGHEGLFDTALAVLTAVTGGGLLGYRILAVLAGMLTLAIVYALVKWLYTPLAAITAMAVLAVGMTPVLLSRTISTDSILPLLVAVVLLALARALTRPRRLSLREPSTTPFAALGLALGVSFYIHPAAFLIALFSMLFLAFVLITRQTISRRSLGYIGFTIVLMVVAVTPYLISSIRLPKLAGASRVFVDFPATQADLLPSLLNGLAGFFLIGDAQPALNLPQRPLIDLVSGLFLLIGVLAALRFWRQPRYMLPLLAALTLLPPALLRQGSPDFYAFAPLLPLIALFVGVGVSAIAHSLPRRSRVVLYVGLLALLAFNLRWTVNDLFTVWPSLPAVQAVYNGRIGQLAHYLDLTGASIPTVICDANLDSPDSPQLNEYELLGLMRHRRDLNLRFANCGISMIFANGGGREQVIFPEAGAIQRVYEGIGDWLKQGVTPTSPAVPADAVRVLDVTQKLANTIGRFTTTAPVLFAPEAPGGTGTTLPPVRFGGNLTFLGYEPVDTGTYKPGDYITLIGYWRVDGPVPDDVRMFTHLLFDPQQIAAQSDIISVSAPQLQPRDVFVQITFLQVPQGLPDGSYRLSIGVYEDRVGSDQDVRLPVFDGNRQRGSRIYLPAITVEK